MNLFFGLPNWNTLEKTGIGIHFYQIKGIVGIQLFSDQKSNHTGFQWIDTITYTLVYKHYITTSGVENTFIWLESLRI